MKPASARTPWPPRPGLLRRTWLAGAWAYAALPLSSTAAANPDPEPELATLDIAGARIDLQLAPGLQAGLRAEALAWVQRSAAAVVGYFGRFPVPQTELLIVPVDGAGVKGGTAYAEPSLLLRLRLGRDTTAAQLRDDWIMVHEMVHLAVPRVPRRQNWLHEGIATYVEGVARVQAGLSTPERLWGELVRGMPHGQPQEGDRGLDHTPTWGRTYWGGALFCLLADVQIRQRSAHRVGLQQALQGVLAGGGHYGQAWSVARTLAVADAAIKQTTLTELHALMGACPAPVDLAALWQDLGVEASGSADAALHDDAPLAAVRRAILA